MADAPRQQTAALEERLLKEPHRFPFQQAVRLLHHLLRIKAEAPLTEDQLDDAVRSRPELSLAFAPADIVAIDRMGDDAGRFQLTVTFLGLYGTSSPLPTFYTEELLDEWREGQHLCRHFFDLVNHSLYTLFFRGWAKYQLPYQLHENRNERTGEQLFALLGLPDQLWRDRIRQPLRLLRLIGLTTQNPRSAAGLRAMLRDFLDTDRVEVEQCVRRRVTIPDRQRLLLGVQGCRLGEDSFVGAEMEERGSAFRLTIDAANAAQFHNLLPDRPTHAEIVELVRFYVDRPLVWDIQLSLPADAIQPATLGGGEDGCWAQLGWNTWLHTDGSPIDQHHTRVLLTGPDPDRQDDGHLFSPFAPGGSMHAQG